MLEVVTSKNKLIKIKIMLFHVIFKILKLCRNMGYGEQMTTSGFGASQRSLWPLLLNVKPFLFFSCLHLYWWLLKFFVKLYFWETVGDIRISLEGWFWGQWVKQGSEVGVGIGHLLQTSLIVDLFLLTNFLLPPLIGRCLSTRVLLLSYGWLNICRMLDNMHM